MALICGIATAEFLPALKHAWVKTNYEVVSLMLKTVAAGLDRFPAHQECTHSCTTNQNLGRYASKLTFFVFIAFVAPGMLKLVTSHAIFCTAAARQLQVCTQVESKLNCAMLSAVRAATWVKQTFALKPALNQIRKDRAEHRQDQSDQIDNMY